MKIKLILNFIYVSEDSSSNYRDIYENKFKICAEVLKAS